MKSSLGSFFGPFIHTFWKDREAHAVVAFRVMPTDWPRTIVREVETNWKFRGPVSGLIKVGIFGFDLVSYEANRSPRP